MLRSRQSRNADPCRVWSCDGSVIVVSPDRRKAWLPMMVIVEGRSILRRALQPKNCLGPTPESAGYATCPDPCGVIKHGLLMSLVGTPVGGGLGVTDTGTLDGGAVRSSGVGMPVGLGTGAAVDGDTVGVFDVTVGAVEVGAPVGLRDVGLRDVGGAPVG